jgi:hypothetical protein
MAPQLMRRRDKEVTDRRVIEDLIANATVCRIAMVDAGEPYIGIGRLRLAVTPLLQRLIPDTILNNGRQDADPTHIGKFT